MLRLWKMLKKRERRSARSAPKLIRQRNKTDWLASNCGLRMTPTVLRNLVRRLKKKNVYASRQR